MPAGVGKLVNSTQLKSQLNSTQHDTGGHWGTHPPRSAQIRGSTSSGGRVGRAGACALREQGLREKAMLPESTEGRLRQAPAQRVMDGHACIRSSASVAQTLLAPAITEISVSPFYGLRPLIWLS